MDESSRPVVVVLAGPNGAGKTTASKHVLRDVLDVCEFVNADEIAAGLCAFAPETVALTAGKIMLRRLRELATARRNFAFETTLAATTFAPWLRGLVAEGYECHLAYFWLPTPDAAILRVQARVAMGATTCRRTSSAGAGAAASGTSTSSTGP